MNLLRYALSAALNWLLCWTIPMILETSGFRQKICTGRNVNVESILFRLRIDGTKEKRVEMIP